MGAVDSCLAGFTYEEDVTICLGERKLEARPIYSHDSTDNSLGRRHI